MTSFTLPVRLDTPAASALAVALQRRIEAGNPLDIFAGDVDQAGLACLQVLASARETARAGKVAFLLMQPSDAMREACQLAGLGILLEPISEGSPA